MGFWINTRICYYLWENNPEEGNVAFGYYWNFRQQRGYCKQATETETTCLPFRLFLQTQQTSSRPLPNAACASCSFAESSPFKGWSRVGYIIFTSL